MPVVKQGRKPLRKNLLNKLDPTPYGERAVDLLESVTKEDKIAWYNNPCTQSLIYSLEGDIAGILLLWINGGYSSEDSSAGTAQSQAKARGMAQALTDVRELIEDIKRDEEVTGDA